MKRLSVFTPVILSILMLSMFFISGGCSNPKPEGFAIYLTANDIPPMDMSKQSHFDLADKPVIASADIVSYFAVTHEIRLTDAAFERITSLQVPVRGTSFVVCVDMKPIYWGAFWTPISSISFDGVTIWQQFVSQETKTIQLTISYPSPSFYGGEDPRGNAEIMQALEKSGKLISTLPHSMAGYELYSWQQDGRWNFTLITGTNRDKTPEEVTSNANTVAENAWVQIHVVSMDAIKSVLATLPQNEEVLWLPEPREPGATSDIIFSYPPQDSIDELVIQARKCGFKLETIQLQ